MTSRKTPPVEHQSSSPLASRIEALTQLFPEAASEDGIDFDALADLLDKPQDRTEKYSFTWWGKQEALRSLAQPSQASLKPAPGESVNWDGTEHLFIEGENLEVLKLLHKSYANRVKMIYIDPPYNTGNDYVYPDNYTEPYDNYLRETGQVDENGNYQTSKPEKNGRKHSNWLSMMYPRLALARQLLRDDGVIFVSIDDNEVHHLRLLMDMVFGEENFLADFVWESTKSNTNPALVSISHTYNLSFAKILENIKRKRSNFKLHAILSGFINPDNDPRGPWKADPFEAGGERPNQMYPIKNPNTGEIFYPRPGNCWKNDRNRFTRLLADNRIFFGNSGKSRPQRKRFKSEAIERGLTPNTWWDDLGTTTSGTSEIKKLFGEKVFPNPKPYNLIQRMLQLSTHPIPSHPIPSHPIPSQEHLY